MKAIICDICNKPIMDRQHKIIIKREMYSFYERWFNKLDVCEKCADRIIYTLKMEVKK